MSSMFFPSQNEKTSLRLKKLKNTLADTKPVGELAKLERRVVCVCHLRGDVSVYNHFNCCRWTREVRNAWTSDRSCAHGYSNIFVTSPSPENLKTLFEFIFMGLDVLRYEEHLDYDIAQSTPDLAILRVNGFRQHCQTIQVSLLFIFTEHKS